MNPRAFMRETLRNAVRIRWRHYPRSQWGDRG
jgi:hypothetical protein